MSRLPGHRAVLVAQFIDRVQTTTSDVSLWRICRGFQDRGKERRGLCGPFPERDKDRNTVPSSIASAACTSVVVFPVPGGATTVT